MLEKAEIMQYFFLHYGERGHKLLRRHKDMIIADEYVLGETKARYLVEEDLCKTKSIEKPDIID